MLATVFGSWVLLTRRQKIALLGIALLRVVLNFLDLLAISLIAGVVALFVLGGSVRISGRNMI